MTGVRVITLLVRFVNANVAQVACKPFALPHMRVLDYIDLIYQVRVTSWPSTLIALAFLLLFSSIVGLSCHWDLQP